MTVFFKTELSRIRQNTLTFILLMITAATVLYLGFEHKALKQAVSYLITMLISALIIDYFALKGKQGSAFPVRKPGLETAIFFGATLFGLVFFYFRFLSAVPWEQRPPLVKLAVLPSLAFAFPIGHALIFLFLRYKPKDLGLRFQGFLPVIPVIVLSALVNRLFSPESLTWNTIVKEEGSLAAVFFSGLITAGLSEEFFRVLGQTRTGAIFKNPGLGWFLTTVFWAFLHAPKWYSENHDLREVVFSSVRIIPIGLIWGYLTHRTRSILPATLVHGMNFWGLQNF
jgi:membrane protease YdiL (CAAX protease family)